MRVATFLLQLRAVASLVCPDGTSCDWINGGKSDDCWVYDDACVEDGCHISTCPYVVDKREDCYSW